MNLYENGIDFIERSLESYIQAKENTDEYKYAIMFLGIGVELILKSILESEHPLFVLDSLDGDNKKTISSAKIIDRLKLVHEKKGRSIKEADVKNLESIRIIRNNILHREVHFEEEPTRIFSSTLYSLDRMVKLFFDKTLANTLKNWKMVVNDDAVRQQYHHNIGGFKLGDYNMPCPFCSLNTIVQQEVGFICKHCNNNYDNILQLLEDLQIESKTIDDMLCTYIEVLLEKTSPKSMEIIKSLNAIKSNFLKDMSSNKIISCFYTKNIKMHECHECNYYEYLFYEESTDKMLCIRCGEIELEKCDRCQKSTFLTDYEGYEYCYYCDENTKGEYCDLCHSSDSSTLNTIILDIKSKHAYEKHFEYSINEPPFFRGKCCQECHKKLYSLESQEAIVFN